MVGTIEEQHDPIHQIGTSNVMTDTPSIVVTETDTNVNHSNADSVMSYGSIENQPVALDEEQSAVFLKKDETIIRDKSKHNIFYLLLINTYSSVRVFTGHLITLESLISVGLSVGFTLFVYDKIQNDNELKSIFNGSVMSWTLLSFAIITPISAAVTMAFRRRELALTQIITVRSTLLCLYTSHCVWDWDWKKNIHNDGFDITTGRQRSSTDWLQYTDEVCTEMLAICHEVTSLLTLPCSSRARHRCTPGGLKEAKELDDIGSRYKVSIIKRCGRLGVLCETLKQEGLPGNEAARMRQWERVIMMSIDQLYAIKMYRTPQGLRSFARLFSIILPPLFAPYYAQLAIDVNSIGLAITFSVVTAIALTSLFETINQMEDPFDGCGSLDDINVSKELISDMTVQLLALRQQYFPHAGPFHLKTS